MVDGPDAFRDFDGLFPLHTRIKPCATPLGSDGYRLSAQDLMDHIFSFSSALSCLLLDVKLNGPDLAFHHRSNGSCSSFLSFLFFLNLEDLRSFKGLGLCFLCEACNIGSCFPSKDVVPPEFFKLLPSKGFSWPSAPPCSYGSVDPKALFLLSLVHSKTLKGFLTSTLLAGSWHTTMLSLLSFRT